MRFKSSNFRARLKKKKDLVKAHKKSKKEKSNSNQFDQSMLRKTSYSGTGYNFRSFELRFSLLSVFNTR